MMKQDKTTPGAADRGPRKWILFKYWFPVVAYALLIFIFSSMPEPPRLIPPLFPHSDKVSHFLEYAILGFLLLRALDSTKLNFKSLNLRMIAVILAIIYGISDEIHQYFVPGRFMEFGDLLSDGFGAYLGQLFFRLKIKVSDPSPVTRGSS